ncbi:MAG: hypothetical protein L0Z48_12490 [candidate division Zixibacteria bacterium]|nr:hypothetical protein [candidate division Zixibacteria bacterium]
MGKLLTLKDFQLTEKDVTGQKRIDPRAALAIFEGRIAGTERLDCYVYRIAPKPPFAPKGTPAYLTRLETPKTLDELKAEIGGGVFRFVGNSFSEKEEATNQRKTVVDFLFEIDGPPLAERTAPGSAPRRGEPGSSPLVDGPAAIGRPAPTQGNRVDEELAFLQKAKLYKEIFGGNGNDQSGETKLLDAFLKGVEFRKAMENDKPQTGSTGWDMAKEVIALVREEAGRRPRPATHPAPAPAGEVHIEPPAVAVAGEPEKEVKSLPNLDALLEYLMDSFDEGKPAGQTAEEVVSLVPNGDLRTLFAFTDEHLISLVENGSKQYEGNWLAERPAEKRAWIGETVKVARSLLPIGEKPV